MDKKINNMSKQLQYRLLNEGEILNGGDEFYSFFDNRWIPIPLGYIGAPVPSNSIYRRPIKQNPEDLEPAKATPGP